MKGSGVCAIDLGVENIAAIVSSKGDCWLYKGGVLKEKNQWYNKQLARLRSIAMKGHDPKEAAKMGLLNTKQMRRLHQKRDLFFHDAMHKISSRIVQECMDHGITTIVIGVNEQWKQSIELGKNTQPFVQMPFYQLRKMIEYKAKCVGIEVISQEESYTSKADLTAGDHIPTYGVDVRNKVWFRRRRRHSTGIQFRPQHGTCRFTRHRYNHIIFRIRESCKLTFESEQDFTYRTIVAF